MTSEERLESLKKAARLAGKDPYYLGGILETYQRREGLNLEDLARYLGCVPDLLPRLALCRRPDASALRFRAEVETIAERFGLKAENLAQVVRAADAFRQLSPGMGAFVPGQLMAARDRESPQEETEDPEP